jgi:hypothetical protein
MGFSHSACDRSLFFYHNGNDTEDILLYVDDIILNTSSDTFRRYIMSHLSCEFAMKDLGHIRHSGGLFLSQHKYVEKIIEIDAMPSCKPISTLVDTKAKLNCLSSSPDHNPSEYQCLAGALQYLTFSRHDIHHICRSTSVSIYS